ncbi:MAG: hypothetical protein ACLU9S_23915 [Oscillospiraceae bacterium]
MMRSIRATAAAIALVLVATMMFCGGGMESGVGGKGFWRIREACPSALLLWRCLIHSAVVLPFFDSHFPIRLAASQTAELEEKAKGRHGEKEHEEKDAIALFTPEEKHVYQWDVFREQVQKGKLEALKTFFLEYPERGNAFFLHHIGGVAASRRKMEGTGQLNWRGMRISCRKLEPKRNSPQISVAYREFGRTWPMVGLERRGPQTVDLCKLSLSL